VETPKELVPLAEALATGGTRAAIVGPPGSGRRHQARTLAALLARSNSGLLQTVPLDASHGFTDLALQLLAWQQAQASPPPFCEGEILSEQVRRHGQRGQAVLLVLENLPSEEGGQALERRLAQALAPWCRRLVTQRNATETGGACLVLGALPEPEALALLRSPAPLTSPEDNARRELVHRIAALPLALTWLARAAQQGAPDFWSTLLARHRALEAEALAPLPTRSPLADAPGCAPLLLALWRDLAEPAQRLGLLLGAMGPAPVPRELLDFCSAIAPDVAPQEGLAPLEQAGLVTVRPQAPGQAEALEIHALVHSFLRVQRRLDPAADSSARATVLLALGRLAHGQIAAGLPLAERLPLAPLLPHLREVVNRERRQRPDQELLWPVLGIGRLLEGLEGDEDSRLLQACLDICESVLGPDHPDTGVALLNLAALHDNAAPGDPRAELLLLRALELRRTCFGDGDPATMAAQARLGMVLAARGERERAIPLLEEALAAREQRQGSHHPDLLGPLNRVMAVQQAHGAHARAERLGRRILEIQEQQFGADHPERAPILQRLGHLQELQGQPQRAEGYYSRALEALRNHLGPNDPSLAPLLGRLGSLALGRGEAHQAEEHFRQALAVLPGDQPEAGRWLQDLARLHQGRGELAEAERCSREALALLERTLGPWHPETASTLNELGWLRSQRQAPAEALSLCERALGIRRRSLGSHHLETASSLNTLAALHEQANDPEEALALYQEALEITETQLGADHPATRTVRANLRNCSDRVDQLRQAS
jgi:tetratricopeptide (TPR) repeat protein